MTTHITKAWFDGTDIVTQEIPAGEAYKREWVGLTELEKSDLWKRDTPIPFSYADAIEAKLKEKNFD